MKNNVNKIRETRRLLREAAHIDHDHEHDGVDRRGFLKCMAWAGTGMLWTISGGVLSSRALGGIASLGAEVAKSDLFFVQISDSHIGFSKEANKDVTATITYSNGRTVKGYLTSVSDFKVVIRDEDGRETELSRKDGEPKVALTDRLQYHLDLLARYQDSDMHDLTAYLATLK